MSSMADILIVGCGLSGSVLARYCAEKLNKKVLIWEQRNHIAGNMYDYIDDHGIMVQKYGPHAFHTNKEYIFRYLCQYENWIPYRLTTAAYINNKFTPTPFNFKTIDDYYPSRFANLLKDKLVNAFYPRKAATILELLNYKDNAIKEYANFLLENDYKPYAAKQWEIPFSEIDISIFKRMPIRFSYKTEYYEDTYQIAPINGYTQFFNKLLNHPNICVKLGINALDHLSINSSKDKLLIDGISDNTIIIYTGMLDDLLGKIEGDLPYRSLLFEWKHEATNSFQDYPIVAYPQAKDFTRITEYKKLPHQNVVGTTYALEYPLPYCAGKLNEPYYPVLTNDSKNKYEIYKEKSMKIKNLYCCGRLADFKYYYMDQALERALSVCGQLKKKYKSGEIK
jgi:UDP-galactopyranose mutase